MSVDTGQIFNVAKPTGTEQAKFKTTASEAERGALNRTVAKEVEQNAEQAQDVARQAALAAHSMGPEMTGEMSAVEVLKSQAQRTTNAAVAEGQANIQSAKATGAGYLEQASTMASEALASARSYIPGHGQHDPNTTAGQNDRGPASGVGSQLQSGGATALSTAKEYISAAQTAAQPHVDSARTTLQPHIDSAAAAAQPHIDWAKETVQGYVGGGNPPVGDKKHE